LGLAAFFIFLNPDPSTSIININDDRN